MASQDAFGNGGMNEHVDPDELLESIGLDESEIAWRKSHLDFGEEDAGRLSDLQDFFRTHQDEVADRFYENLLPHDRTMAIFGRSPKGVEQLKETQRAYLVTLGAGEYGESYFRNRARIGKLHELLDMPLAIYIGQYGVYYNLVFDLLDERVQSQVVEAIQEWTAEELEQRDDGGIGSLLTDALGATDGSDYAGEAAELSASLEETVRESIHDGLADLLAVLRVFNLDMQVAVDTYVDSYSERLERAIERHERLAREVQRDVQEPLVDVDRAAEQVADGAQRINALAADADEDVQRIADEVSNLSAATEEVASTAENVHERSTEAHRRARTGRNSAEEALDAMADVEAAARDAGEGIGVLDDVFEDLDGTVDLVDDLAWRTRQLGRRASLEATKTGGDREKLRELADEVKAFSEETESQLETLTGRVESMRGRIEGTVDDVEETVDAVETGAERVEASMADLDEIVDAVEEVTDGVEDVAEAADSQARSTEEVATAADGAASRTERVAAETDDIAAATEEQKAQVEQIAHNVSRLTDES